MRYRPFGRHGFEVSAIGFGAWAIGGSWGAQADADSLAALRRALDLGVTFIDPAAGTNAPPPWPRPAARIYLGPLP